MVHPSTASKHRPQWVVQFMLGGFKTFQNASLFVELKIFCLWAPDICSELCLPINTVLPKHSNSNWAKFPWESYFWLGSEVIHSWICNPHSVKCVEPEKALKFAWLNAFVNLTYSCTALAALSPKESFLMDCSISLFTNFFWFIIKCFHISEVVVISI